MQHLKGHGWLRTFIGSNGMMADWRNTMEYYKQTFCGGDETIYAMAYDTCKNGNRKAVIISNKYGGAKKTTFQNIGLWAKVTENDVPDKYKAKLINAIK
jgi:hypothetical protein